METTVNYLIQSGFALLVLYLFYRLVLRNQPSLYYNRAYLLLAPLAALVIPLLELPLPFEAALPAAKAIPSIQLQEIQVVGYTDAAPVTTQLLTIGQLLITLYSIVGLVLLIRLGTQLARIRQLASTATPLQGTNADATILQTEGHVPAFAFLNYVFLGSLAHLSDKEQQQVLRHELAHVRLRHTYDILYFEVLTAIFWFNPLVWLLKEELRDVHEYQADAEVLSDYQPQEYSSLLAKEALYVTGIPVGSYFQKPQVFRRLHMLQQYGRPSSRMRPLLALPVVLLLLFAFSVNNQASADVVTEQEEPTSLTEILVTAPARKAGIPIGEKSSTGIAKESAAVSTERNTSPDKPEPTNKLIQFDEPSTKSAKPEATTSERVKPYSYVEQMPSFIGGETEMLKFLGRNIRYPKTAQEAGVEGLVVVSFVVETDGSLHDITVLKKLHDEADAEAVRVVERMNGQWNAGKQNGVAVPVRYTLPIRFAIK
ncbi:M56 family metallopeptidase [uncultured Pontibacter sp.]|uniref:M56 family metallopeptidase n=1 Tax=uncultured Pontibacter sp. TaxID=453356 RepID=UPI00260442F1|nr:M56 family metallopeptidase [uncultured Pontibacter sp.]